MAGSGVLTVGVSALTSYQRVLSTISHNIANVNTPGYSRQVVDLSSRNPQFFGNGYLGKGVEVQNIRRLTDDFLTSQLQASISNLGEAENLHALASQVDNIFADPATGLTPVLQDFFNGVQNVADDPATIPARQVLLSESESLVGRFHDMNARMDELNREVNDRIYSDVNEINQLAEAIAEVNLSITLSPGIANGILPNDLLDQREALLNQLSEKVAVSTVDQTDGSINVLIGKGQPLVIGSTSQRLTTFVDAADPISLRVGYDAGGNTIDVTDELTSGSLGASIAFRSQLLNPARNGLGRLAAVLAQTFNQQHRQGMDLDGNLGGDFFSIDPPKVIDGPANGGTVTVAFDPAAQGNLTTADYRLDFNGTNFVLTNLADNSTQTFAPPGIGNSFSADGLIFTQTSAPAAGDTWSIQPTRELARSFALAVDAPRQIAAAAPIRASAALGNQSDAAISTGTVLDVNDPNLLTTANIVFDNPPTTYRINGGASQAYTSGGNIDFNGWRVQITGTPAAGDTFTVQSNTGGAGDNRNALALAALQTTDILDGGSTTFQGAYGQIIT
ncbi:MAG: flagellar hook-associated protein FlgK, partial [Gammaproteobacteria bacterium]